ncbi:MAG: putative porin [Balneolaceae bacterium]
MSRIASIWLFIFIFLHWFDALGYDTKFMSAHQMMNRSVSTNNAADTTHVTFRQLPAIQFSDGLPMVTSPDTLNRATLTWIGSMDESVSRSRPDTVHIWTYQNPADFELAASDSTLRWVQLLNMFDRFYNEKGTVTYRMGTVGRMDGIELHAFETRHLTLEMEGLQLNDPLTGAVNWNRLPVHKVSEMVEADYGATYRARSRLKDHYLVEPRTYLNFDESKYNHRSLEFSFTQNFRNTTNLELSFWDRRDGGGYNRQDVEGRQVVARIYHQLNKKWLLKSAYINNSMERQEPFGYNITDPVFFGFNRFTASSVQSNAGSDQTSSDIYLQLHHRSDVKSDVMSKLGLHYQTDKYSLTSNVDSVATHFQRIELFARHYAELMGTEISGTARFYFLNEKVNQNLIEDNWIGSELSLNITKQLIRNLSVDGEALLKSRNDFGLSGEVSARVRFEPGQRTHISLFGGKLSRAPDLQSLYWQSNLYSGDESLIQEESLLMGAMAELPVTETVVFGLRGDHRLTDNAVFIDSDGQFTLIDPYSMTSGTGWVAHNSRRFEGEISATYKTFSSTGANQVNRTLSAAGERIWVKGNIYWKNYLFNSATFVKAGLSGVYSPNPFRTAEFMTPLNRWQHGTNEFVNPSYYRVDLDISARIRWFMVLIKWENIFDRVQQLGYFESVGYPMPERRFRFGIRVLFTN